MLTTKDFNGKEHHAFLQRAYDESRKYLKNCGKPINEIDRFLISMHRENVKIFGGALDRTEAIKRLELKMELEERRDKIQQELVIINKYMLHLDKPITIVKIQ